MRSFQTAACPVLTGSSPCNTTSFHVANQLLREVRTCQFCSAHCPTRPPPGRAAGEHRSTADRRSGARGAKVQQDRNPLERRKRRYGLRDWLQMRKQSVFYEKAQVALLPMGVAIPAPERAEAICGPVRSRASVGTNDDSSSFPSRGQRSWSVNIVAHYCDRSEWASMTRNGQSSQCTGPQFSAAATPKIGGGVI